MYKPIAQNTDTDTDRFNSVELLADQIFDRIPALEPEDDAQEFEEPAGENVVSLFSRPAPRRNPNPSRAEQLLGSLLGVLDQAGKLDQVEKTEETQDNAADFTHAPDIGYEAAFRRSQLPAGVEPLKAQPTATNETQTMSNIRSMMQEQEVEREKVRIAHKRQKAKEILPPIEPQDTFEPAPTPQTKVPRPTLSRRAARRLDRAFRNYYFLAISLSAWCTMAMMVVIEPAVGQGLGLLSLLLLVAASCMFSRKTAVVRACARSR